VILLSAAAAEKHGVKPCIRIIRIKPLPVKGDFALFFRHQRGIDLSCARDEPMEFEGKKARSPVPPRWDPGCS